MTEATQVWYVLRRYAGPFGHLVRVESRLTGVGIPDVNYCLRGVEGWLELKMGQRDGEPPESLTLDQVVWLERRTAAGGRAFLLARYGPAWRLYNAAATRALFQRAADRPLFDVTGRFPLRALLDAIAPIGRDR